MKASPITKHISAEQLILLHIYKKKSQATTIEELQKELELPRTSIVDHLRLLEQDSLLNKSKIGRVWHYYPIPEIAERILKALTELKSAYIYALHQIRELELKKLKEEKEVLEKER